MVIGGKYLSVSFIFPFTMIYKEQIGFTAYCIHKLSNDTLKTMLKTNPVTVLSYFKGQYAASVYLSFSLVPDLPSMPKENN